MWHHFLTTRLTISQTFSNGGKQRFTVKAGRTVNECKHFGEHLVKWKLCMLYDPAIALSLYFKDNIIFLQKDIYMCEMRLF